MSDYSQGKIYKLYIPGIDEVCYIGSTITSLSERFDNHKYQANNINQKKTGAAPLFEEGNEVVISLIEEYPCQTKQELEARERYWIEQYPDCVNKNIPTRGWKERWEQNRQHNLDLHKKWIEENKEQQAAYKKAKREADLEAARSKEREANARRDKEKRNAWKKAKVTCDKCGIKLSRNNFPTHKKNKHTGEEVNYTIVTE